MRSTLTTGALTFLACLASPVFGASISVPPTWTCQRCTAGQGWDLDLGLGPAYVADDAYRFGDFTGLDEKGAYLFGDLNAGYVDDRARYFRLDGMARGADAANLDLEAGRQGAWEVRAGYQAIPRRFFQTTVTPYLGSGTGVLTLPEAWVRAPTTAGMSALDQTLTPVAIERDLDLWNLELTVRPGTRWRLDVDLRRQEKTGTDLGSAGVLFSAVELPKPVDYTTDDLSLTLRTGGDGWEASLGYLGSYFDNGEADLIWDNPFSSSLGADGGQQVLAPDNELHQLRLTGALRLPKRTLLSGALAVGRQNQDGRLVPYTINPSIAAAPLPVTTVDAEADTLNLNLRAVTRPWRRITLEGEIRVRDFDNRTDRDSYAYVVTDAVPAATPVTNPTYDYDRQDLKLRGEFRPGGGLALHLGYDRRRFERNAQDRRETTTDRFWFRVHRRLGRGADLDFDLFVENRDGSGYEALDRAVSEQNPLLRKYNLSDRERYGLRLKGTITPAERWDFGWELEYGEDDHDGTEIGLTRSRYARAGADASWLLGRQGMLFGAVYTETVEADQAGSQAFGAADWAATSADRFDNASFGFEHPALVGALGMKVTYDWSHGRGEIEKNTSGLASRFPDLTSRRHRLDLGFTYPLSRSWSAGLNYVFEKVRSDDWSLAGVDPATVRNLLSLGADPFNYEVNLVYLSFRYTRPGQ